MDDQRLARMTHNARQLASGGHLRSGMSVRQAGEILWTYTSPDLYDLLVGQRGWTIDQYREFLFRGMSGHLLESEGDT